MTTIKPFNPLKISGSLCLAAVLSVLLYALFDVRWWPRIGNQDFWRGLTLAFLHFVAIVQYPLVFSAWQKLHGRG